jgi:hypothetical protein
LNGFCFTVKNKDSLLLQGGYRFTHQIESTQRMLKTSVLSTRINNVCKPQLPNAREPLHEGMLDNIEKQSLWNLDKPEDRVAYNLAIVQFLLIL